MQVTHIGTQQIETQRLILRRFKESDAQSVFDNWASDPLVTKHLTWNAHGCLRVTKMVLRDWIIHYAKSDYYQWAITQKGSDVPIGDINIHTAHVRLCGEIGYCLSRSFWNQGIMTEALRAVIDFGLRKVGYVRLQSYFRTDNPASGRVMQKAGMHSEGVLSRYGEGGDGRLYDCEMYAIFNDG